MPTLPQPIDEEMDLLTGDPPVVDQTMSHALIPISEVTTHNVTDSTSSSKDDTKMSDDEEETTTTATTTSTSSGSNYRSSYSYWTSNEDGQPEVRGAVGLKNLGNTCFMASTLQCLSHCPPLTQYFLSDTYLQHINRTNPLGFKGRVSEEYGSLIKEIWSDKFKVVAPREFKEIIGTVQPRFAGYQQHDSSELLAFLLDGLHEDLNRVLDKPATGTIDSNGREDKIVAAEAWENYLKRNQSIIVDILQGQLKSKVVCPIETCKKVSITFDPFQFLSVPLPVTNDTSVAVYLVYADPRRPITQVGVFLSKVARMHELKVAVCAAVGDIANPRRLVLGDMFSHRIYKFFDEDGTVGDIKSNDTVYAFECPEIEDYKETGGFHPIQILFQEKEEVRYYSRFNSKYNWSNMAAPRVICLPKKTQVSVRFIVDLIHRKTAAYLHSSTPVDPATAEPIPLTRQEEESAYEIIIADEKGENCGHHDMSGWSTDKCTGCVLREYSNQIAREEAEAAAAKAKAEAYAKKYPTTASASPASLSTNTWAAFLPDEPEGDSSAAESSSMDLKVDIKDEDVTMKDDTKDETKSTDDESTGSGVIVSNSPVSSTSNEPTPSPEDQLSDSLTTVDLPKLSENGPPSSSDSDDFVKVEANGSSSSSGPEGSPVASPPVAPTPNLDVPFEVKLQKTWSYSSYASDMIPRCSFAVRLVNCQKPSETKEPSANSAVLVGKPVTSLDDDEVEAKDGESTPTVAVPWFDKDACELVVKHASVDAAEKEDNDSVTVLDCVKAFTKEETLSEEDPWYCSSCKEHRQATKKFDLWKLPSILIIHLKRFSYSRYSRDKISTYVNFPIVGLDVSEATANPEHAGELYDLIGVSNHMGGLGGGHYNAYVRNHTNGVWYLHDDSSVSRVRHLSDIRSSAAYVLFYQRREKGAIVKTELEIEAEMQTYFENLPKPSWMMPSTSSSSSTSSFTSRPIPSYSMSSLDHLD